MYANTTPTALYLGGVLIEAGGRADVDATDPDVAAAIAAGLLVECDNPVPATPPASAAVDKSSKEK